MSTFCWLYSHFNKEASFFLLIFFGRCGENLHEQDNVCADCVCGHCFITSSSRLLLSFKKMKFFLVSRSSSSSICCACCCRRVAMLFLPHNKNRPNYHPAVGQLCGSHHVTQTDESQTSSQPEGKKQNKTKRTYFYDWEGTAWGETNGTYNFSKHIVVSYSKIQQMLLKVRERERESAPYEGTAVPNDALRTFVLEAP